MAIIGGVDGCSGGWLCVLKDLSNGRCNGIIVPEILTFLNTEVRIDLLAIDIPIGLPDSGPRDADTEARKCLGARKSSVFPCPVRPVLMARNYLDACQIHKQTDGRAISWQAYSILNKIVEVDSMVRTVSDIQIKEVHPEVSFRYWKGEPLAYSKSKPEGRTEREALLIPKYGDAYKALQDTLPSMRYENDDLVDAFAALWTAERIYSGASITLPTNPPLDSCGLRMEINV